MERRSDSESGGSRALNVRRVTTERRSIDTLFAQFSVPSTKRLIYRVTNLTLLSVKPTANGRPREKLSLTDRQGRISGWCGEEDRRTGFSLCTRSIPQ